MDLGSSAGRAAFRDMVREAAAGGLRSARLVPTERRLGEAADLVRMQFEEEPDLPLTLELTALYTSRAVWAIATVEAWRPRAHT